MVKCAFLHLNCMFFCVCLCAYLRSCELKVSAIIKYVIIYCTGQHDFNPSLQCYCCGLSQYTPCLTPCIPLHWLTHFRLVCFVMEISCICVCLCSVVQEACANVWPVNGHETIDHFDIQCSEDQSFDGYDTVKLEITNISKVSSHVAQHSMYLPECPVLIECILVVGWAFEFMQAYKYVI